MLWSGGPAVPAALKGPPLPLGSGLVAPPTVLGHLSWGPSVVSSLSCRPFPLLALSACGLHSPGG